LQHTVKKAKELALTGWVKNTAHGSVIGHMEGTDGRVHDM
jgi:acylphosphatase